eukprot:3180299-Pyramimonas_sp.AAC.1
MSAPPPHVSEPQKELHRRFTVAVSTWRHPFRHTPHTLRGPMRSSTEGPSCNVRMPPPHPFRHTPQT